MWISPFFADLTKMELPSALFTIGTLDCLMDDSVLMSAKWTMSGAESILKVYPGEQSNRCDGRMRRAAYVVQAHHMASASSRPAAPRRHSMRLTILLLTSMSDHSYIE